jgi:hypothetical protein
MNRERKPSTSDIAADQDRFARIWGVIAILVSIPCIGAGVWIVAIERVFSVWVIGCSILIGVPALVFGVTRVFFGASSDE